LFFESVKCDLSLRKARRLRILENRALRRIFEPKREDVTGEWRRLHNEELCVLYLPNIICVIKSRRMNWAVHVERTEDTRGAYRGLVGRCKGKSAFEDLGLDGRIILKRVFKKWDEGSVEWIYLAQNTDRLRAVVNSVMDLRVP
jgi:hypothetical protein